MKIIDVVQGTDAWLAVRLGIPSASRFHDIVGNATGELSRARGSKTELGQGAKSYAAELIAEALLGRPLEKPPGSPFAIVRGKELEPLAVQQYEFTTDDNRLGCSPDRLVIGARGGVEIKCALDGNHMRIFIDGPGDDYKPQVQGQLAIAELEWVDFYAYHPHLPPRLIRTCRDEPYIAKLNAALTEFLDIRDAMLIKARASGFFEERAALAEAA